MTKFKILQLKMLPRGKKSTMGIQGTTVASKLHIASCHRVCEQLCDSMAVHSVRDIQTSVTYQE